LAAESAKNMERRRREFGDLLSAVRLDGNTPRCSFPATRKKGVRSESKDTEAAKGLRRNFVSFAVTKEIHNLASKQVKLQF
jgi:hypothetical protein